jgi:hypothetical protein
MTSKHPFVYGTLHKVTKIWKNDGWHIKPKEDTQKMSNNLCGDIL